MVEIIPAINCSSFEEVQEKIRIVEPYVKWCHVDVTDGIFSKHITWHDPLDLPNLNTSLKLEVHLMIAEPEKIIDRWILNPVRRLIVHIEASKDLEFIVSRCRNANIEIGLALCPETFWAKFKPWFGRVDLFQILAVQPGPSGQILDNSTFDKVSHLRRACNKCIIEVDGGINFDTAPKAVKSGADILVAGSVVFSSKNTENAIQKLISSVAC